MKISQAALNNVVQQTLASDGVPDFYESLKANQETNMHLMTALTLIVPKVASKVTQAIVDQLEAEAPGCIDFDLKASPSKVASAPAKPVPVMVSASKQMGSAGTKRMSATLDSSDSERTLTDRTTYKPIIDTRVQDKVNEAIDCTKYHKRLFERKVKKALTHRSLVSLCGTIHGHEFTYRRLPNKGSYLAELRTAFQVEFPELQPKDLQIIQTTKYRKDNMFGIEPQYQADP